MRCANRLPPIPFLNLTTTEKVRRILIALAGGTVLALGVTLVVLPGPAFLVIPAGLAILAAEFAWAERWLRGAKQFVSRKARFISWPRCTVGLPANERRN